MTARWIRIVVACIVAAIVMGALAHRSSSASGASKDKARTRSSPPAASTTALPPKVGHLRQTSAGESMATVSPYQLSLINVGLSASTAPPGIDEASAVKTAEGVFGDPIVEVDLATCHMLAQEPVAVIPCYAVSEKPQASGVLRGSNATFNQDHPAAYTFELVLVDSRDGSLIEGYRSNVPASATG